MSVANKIEVFIVDDHPIFRHGLRQVLEADPRVVVVGDAADGEAALAQIKTAQPQVAVVDLTLPGMDGLALTAALQKLRPAIPVIVLTMHKDEHLIRGALDRGARGYILKDNALHEALGAILAVAKGDFYITPALSQFLVQRDRRAAALRQKAPGLDSLTPMERRVLKLLAESKTSRAIGKELFISARTVETHRNNMCVKLGFRGSHKLLEFAITHRSEL
ncbi:MAG TPA: response regulator transcription factor [Verrucomicrobiae bacterium]|jgi:DNA-binding NarL/FixJ family response regulator|nr:response regulator transcription factor [Verrucomicrobiae bacterium]